jgi:hypothetical protein
MKTTKTADLRIAPSILSERLTHIDTQNGELAMATDTNDEAVESEAQPTDQPR